MSECRIEDTKLIFPLIMPMEDVKDNSVDDCMEFLEVQIKMGRESMRDAIKQWKERKTQ